MKSRILFLAVLFLFVSQVSKADWGIYKTWLGVNGTDYDCEWSSANPLFEGAYLGRFSSGGSLPLDFGQVLTYKNNSGGTGSVCSATMYYRVYRTCDTAPSFSSLSLGFCCAYNATDCEGGTCGPDLYGTGDEKWHSTSAANLISGLTAPGSYVVEVYFSISGDNAGGCTSSAVSDNTGANFRAYFELNTTDSFSDGQFSGSPTWSGDTGNWQIVDNSDAGSATGSESNKSFTLRLNGPLSNATQYLSTSLTTWESQQEWYFWTGRRGQAATASNRTIVWLYATESNLESATNDGYRLVIGDDTGNDEIRLQRVDNGTATDFFVTSSAITDGITDWGMTFKITRSTDGRWRVRTSTVPSSTGDGAKALDCPNSSSSVLHTNSLNSQQYADDDDYTPSGTAYMGVVAEHTSSSSAAAGAEFDSFRMLPLTPDTELNFTLTGATINENLGGGTYNLVVAITNPSATTATTADIVLTAGNDDRINNYTTQTVTFPASSSSNQTVTLTITDNSACDGIEHLVFELQNVAGGTNAAAGTTSSFALNVVDDNTGYATIVTDDFEDNNINGWTSTIHSGSSGNFASSSSAPITGNYSMRHTYTGSSGSAYVYYDTDDACLPGVETTWRFNLKTFNREPSPTNKWLVFLTSSHATLFSGDVDGYALGVNPAGSGDPDILSLWRVDNGTVSSTIIAADGSDVIYDWGTTENEVGFEVTRDAEGLWTMKVDANGDFDNLSTIGTGTDATYEDMSYFGMRYTHTSSLGGELAMDDVTILQESCKGLYYSRASGNFNDSIWSTASSGLPDPEPITPGRYTDLIVQNGHSVTLNTNIVCNNLTINSGGTLNAGAYTIKVFGDWSNSGTFNRGTGTVIMKGDLQNQDIKGSSTTQFNNLTIDNSFGTVTLVSQTEATGVVLPDQGTLQTGGKLTLISNSSGSGSIGQIRGTFSGNVTLQRYIPTGTAGWVNVSCPIQGQTVQTAWNDDIITSGFTGSDYPSYELVNIQYYDESQAGGRNIGWTEVTNTTNGVVGTIGYTIYMLGTAQNLDATGAIYSGSQQVSVPFTNNSNSADGWNLRANIYPSEVDWHAVDAASDGFASYYVYDSALPGYRTYNANDQLGSASRYIPHSQSFFIQSTGANQYLNFEEDQKTATGAAFERDTPESRLMRFRIEREGKADEALIAFVDGATNNYERMYDAEKWESLDLTSPEMAFVSTDNVNMTIDARGGVEEGLSIPVFVDLPSAGTYTIMVEQIQNLPAGTCVSIEDTQSGATATLESGSQFVFSTDEPFTGNRMVIHFSPSAEISVVNSTCFGSDDAKVQLSAGSGTWNYSLKNEMGAEVHAGSLLGEISNLAAGEYTLELTNTDASCGASVIDVTIGEPIELTTWVETSLDECNTSGNGRIEFGVNSADEYAYTVTGELSGEIFSGTSMDPGHLFENLVSDVYTVTISNSCASAQQTADLRDPSAIEATILVSTETVQVGEGESGEVSFEADADNADTFEWTMGETVLSTDPSFTYTFTTPGTFTIHLEASGNGCSSGSDVTVVAEETVGIVESDRPAPVVLAQRDGGIVLSFNGVNSRRAEVRIITALGQIVRSERISTRDGNQVFISLEDLSTAAYTVQIVAGSDILFVQSVVK